MSEARGTAVVDFAVLSPEVNSGRMYVGAGSAPLVAAAAAWDRLAATLTSAAQSYRAVIAELTDGSWRGPSAAAMAAAAEPYLAWMSATAAQAAQTANQARVTAAGYEAAFAATVPPVAVSANRVELANLVNANVFGQNSAAIAANQADYGEMWAQDATAMHAYAAHSAAAAPDLTSFTTPPQTANPAAAGAAAAASPGPLTQLAEKIAANPTLSSLAGFVGTLSTWEGLPIGAAAYQFAQYILFVPMIVGAETVAKSFGAAFMAAGGYGAGLASTVYPAAGMASDVPSGATAATLAGSSGPGVSAGVGRSTPIGGLSAPSSWVTAPQQIRLAAAALPTASTVGGSPGAGMAAPGGMIGGIPAVASLVNAPSSGEPGLPSRSDAKVIPKIARAGGADGADAAVRHHPASHRRLDAAAGDTSSEREELHRLRAATLELTKEREALERSAESLLKQAGLRPASARR